jgi:hypothetical protein
VTIYRLTILIACIADHFVTFPLGFENILKVAKQARSEIFYTHPAIHTDTTPRYDAIIIFRLVSFFSVHCIFQDVSANQ